jgi:hypothetical protein
MTPRASGGGTRRGNLANVGLVLLSCLLATAVAELAIRLIDGLPIFTDWLPDTLDRDVTSASVDSIPLAGGVRRDWFFNDPPPLPNRHAPPAEWERSYREFRSVPYVERSAFRPAELFKAWNSVRVGPVCKNAILKQAPEWIYLHHPSDGSPYPLYRFLPNATTPLGLVTNEIGWRGPPIRIEKAAKTVRIVFVGASTTVNSHYYPYSYPEFVGHWLNLWAAHRGLNVRIETFNAGREAVISTDIAAVVRKEVLPIAPDLVVYYEGHNQFLLTGMLASEVGPAPLQSAPTGAEDSSRRWLRDAAHRSALVRRFQGAVGLATHSGTGNELPKPTYDVRWPDGLSEIHPDIRRSDLPINLSTIISDLESIRKDLEAGGAELAISTYKWLVRDGLVLDPVRNRNLWEHLNIWMWPFSYRDIERMSVFQNRVYARYAATHGLALIDVAAKMPEEPALYTDAVHFSYGGVRLHAWIVLQDLVPLIESRLANRIWPREPGRDGAAPPGLLFEPELIRTNCKI